MVLSVAKRQKNNRSKSKGSPLLAARGPVKRRCLASSSRLAGIYVRSSGGDCRSNELNEHGGRRRRRRPLPMRVSAVGVGVVGCHGGCDPRLDEK